MTLFLKRNARGRHKRIVSENWSHVSRTWNARKYDQRGGKQVDLKGFLFVSEWRGMVVGI